MCVCVRGRGGGGSYILTPRQSHRVKEGVFFFFFLGGGGGVQNLVFTAQSTMTVNNNNNREHVERFQNPKALDNLKKNIQGKNTHNYTTQ